jgi:hypothetical protein
MGDLDFLTVNTSCVATLAKTEISGAVHFDYVTPVGVYVLSASTFIFKQFSPTGDERYFK